MATGERTSVRTRLIRLGFNDASRSERTLAEIGADEELTMALAAAADPDLALAALARIIPAGGPSVAVLNADPEARDRLLSVLGVSDALGDHLVRHPGHWRVLSGPAALVRPSPEELRTALLTAVGGDPAAPEPVATAGSAEITLRVAYRKALLHLAGRDLAGATPLEDVAAELADMAAAALEAGLAIARAEVGEAAAGHQLAVIGMGKCGGRELNYVSDVDVVFVAEPADAVATKLAAGAMRACSASTPEGSLWEVDAALRPEGKAGPLVRTLASHRAYYERWAKTWEFQALLKARPIAGDPELGRAYLDMVTPMVWRAAQRDNFVEDVQAMRRRVEANIEPGHAGRQLKLGPGGLRDVEFAVQLLQLVHGRSDEELRVRNTLLALKKLSWGGYVGRADAAMLATAYRFLRRAEHLIQLHRLLRTHIMPEDERDLRRIGRAMGMRSEPVGELTAAWHRNTREVRRLHEKLFYRPLLQAVASLPDDEVTLSREAARARLEALGYRDPSGALRHIQALTAGVSRRAAIQRTILPLMLGWFADGPDPDAGLLGFRQVSDALGRTPWYMRLLRDDIAVAERMAQLLASSRYVTDLLLRAPEGVAMLGGAAPPQPPSGVARPVLDRYAVAEDAVAALRAVRRRDLFRVAAADVLTDLDVSTVGDALTTITRVTVEGALEVAISKIEMERRGPLPTRVAIVAMGRFGGGEMSYGSDADVMFVHDPLEGADDGDAAAAAHAVAEELRRLLAIPAADPPLAIDPDLRPEGRQGPLVRTVDSYAAYYRRWSSPWESQALLRADPLIGDVGVRDSFRALIDPIRWPRGGIDERAIREIRRLKARMESERLPRGADPSMHTKLGPGGLSDVEWVTQLLQLRHAAAVAEMRTTRTLEALSAATKAGMVADRDAAVLGEAWRLATRVRNAITLVRGRAADVIPVDIADRGAVARVLGYDSAGDLVEDYRRHTRHARAVVEVIFYG